MKKAVVLLALLGFVRLGSAQTMTLPDSTVQKLQSSIEYMLNQLEQVKNPALRKFLNEQIDLHSEILAKDRFAKDTWEELQRRLNERRAKKKVEPPKASIKRRFTATSVLPLENHHG